MIELQAQQWLPIEGENVNWASKEIEHDEFVPGPEIKTIGYRIVNAPKGMIQAGGFFVKQHFKCTKSFSLLPATEKYLMSSLTLKEPVLIDTQIVGNEMRTLDDVMNKQRFFPARIYKNGDLQPNLKSVDGYIYDVTPKTKIIDELHFKHNSAFLLANSLNTKNDSIFISSYKTRAEQFARIKEIGKNLRSYLFDKYTPDDIIERLSNFMLFFDLVHYNQQGEPFDILTKELLKNNSYFKFSLQRLLYHWDPITDYESTVTHVKEGTYAYYVSDILVAIKYVGLYTKTTTPKKDCIQITEDDCYMSSEDGMIVHKLTKKYWSFNQQKPVDADTKLPIKLTQKKWFIFKKNHFIYDTLTDLHVPPIGIRYDPANGGTIRIKVIEVYSV